MIPGTSVRPQAALDAEEIFAYLLKQSFSLARRFNEAVADTLIAIRDDPTIGIRWQPQHGRLTDLWWKRVRGFKNYLIFYRSENGEVVVVRILHGARDLESILG